MKRAWALAVLLACAGLLGCATSIIGRGGSTQQQCRQDDSRDCPR